MLGFMIHISPYPSISNFRILNNQVIRHLLSTVDLLLIRDDKHLDFQGQEISYLLLKIAKNHKTTVAVNIRTNTPDNGE